MSTRGHSPVPGARTGKARDGVPAQGNVPALVLTPAAGGTRLRLRVKAGSSCNAILGVHDGALKVAVIAAPERGRANRAVVKLMAKTLGLAATDLVLLSGTSSPDKTLLVQLPPDETRRLLAASL